MLSIMTLSMGVSGAFVGAALYLYIFQHSAHVKRMGVVSLDFGDYSVESEIRVRWMPFFSFAIYEDFRVLDDEDYYVLREKHTLTAKKGEEV